MRGPDEQTNDMFSYLSPEQRVRPDHPLRAIRRMTDDVLRELSPRFTRMYSDIGRPSIPPEQLLRALLLQALYTIRSERLLMEEIDYSVLFRWFIGLSMDEPIWSPTTFSKNRDRLLEGDVAARSLTRWSDQARGGRPAVGRALHRGRHVARGVGESQELSAQGRRPARRRPTIRAIPRSISMGRRGRTTRIASTTDPDAQLVSEGPGQGGEAGVSRPRAARQSPRAGGQRVRHGGDGHGRTGGRRCCC